MNVSGRCTRAMLALLYVPVTQMMQATIVLRLRVPWSIRCLGGAPCWTTHSCNSLLLLHNQQAVACWLRWPPLCQMTTQGCSWGADSERIQGDM